MELFDFILAQLIMCVVLLTWYRKVLLSPLVLPFSGKVMSMTATTGLFLVLCVVGNVIGLLLTCRRWRNGVSVVFNALFAVGVMSFFELCRYYPTLSWVLAGLTAAAAAVIFWLFLSNPIENEYARFSIILRRLRNGAVVSGRVLGASLALCLVVVCVFSVFGSGRITTPGVAPKVAAGVSNDGDNEPEPEEDLSFLTYLHEDVWDTLTLNERLDVMQIIANREAAHLGTPDVPQLCADVLSPDVLGHYSGAKTMITFSLEHLERDSMSSCLTTVLHEMYHHYQDRVCEVLRLAGEQYSNLMMFWDARQFRDGFADYINEGEAYYYQYVEITARAYASSRIEDYFDLLYPPEEDPAITQEY
jgi:hypothetical protein